MSEAIFEATTHNIHVQVRPEFSLKDSNLEAGVFVYLYTITISNQGKDTVQLLSRHWVIQDALGEEENIIGDGVVGQRPILAPGESFEYTSMCPLKTPTGSMKGRYQFRLKNSELIDVEIPQFQLKDSQLLN